VFTTGDCGAMTWHTYPLPLGATISFYLIKVRYKLIPQDLSLKIYKFPNEKNPKQGRPSTATVNLIRQAEDWFKKYYLSHGSIVGHAYDKYGLLKNQARCTSDIKNGRGDGRHLNVTLMRALIFCMSIFNHWDKLRSVELKNSYPKNTYIPHQFTLEELYRGLVYIYDKQEFMDKIFSKHLAEYMEKTQDSKTVDLTYYLDPNEFLGEYYVYYRKHIKLIQPKFFNYRCYSTCYKTRRSVRNRSHFSINKTILSKSSNFILSKPINWYNQTQRNYRKSNKLIKFN
jgi:hypothetical protein